VGLKCLNKRIIVYEFYSINIFGYYRPIDGYDE